MHLFFSAQLSEVINRQEFLAFPAQRPSQSLGAACDASRGAGYEHGARASRDGGRAPPASKFASARVREREERASGQVGERDDVLQQYRDAALGVANSPDRSTIFFTPAEPTVLCRLGLSNVLPTLPCRYSRKLRTCNRNSSAPARNDSDIWKSLSICYCSRINSLNSPQRHSHQRWILFLPKRFPCFLPRGPTIQKLGHLPPGQTRRQSGQGLGPGGHMGCPGPRGAKENKVPTAFPAYNLPVQ